MQKLEKIIDGRLYESNGDGWTLVQGLQGDFVASAYHTMKLAVEIEKICGSKRGDDLCDLCEKALKEDRILQ